MKKNERRMRAGPQVPHSAANRSSGRRIRSGAAAEAPSSSPHPRPFSSGLQLIRGLQLRPPLRLIQGLQLRPRPRRRRRCARLREPRGSSRADGTMAASRTRRGRIGAAEPSSPKVTCIGQVQIKGGFRGGAALRSLSRRGSWAGVLPPRACERPERQRSALPHASARAPSSATRSVAGKQMY